MPISSCTAEYLQDAFTRFMESDPPPLKLSTDPYYPEFLWIFKTRGDEAEEGDEEQWAYCDLLHRAFDKNSNTDGETRNDEVLCLRAEIRGKARIALYQLEGSVWQISDISPSREYTSVLGRLGVVDILCKQLANVLWSDGKPIERLRIADLARLSLEESDRNSDSIEAIAKLLHRLNNGAYVTESKVQAVGAALPVYAPALYFTNPAIYTPAARKRRDIAQDRRSVEELRNYNVSLQALDVLRPDLTRALRDLTRAGCSIHYERAFVTPAADKAREFAREEAVTEFVKTVNAKHGRQLHEKAILSLKRVGITAWFGQYEDRVRADPSDEEHQLPRRVEARAVRRAVILFREAGKGKPEYTVDLSHSLGLGPTAEEIFRDFGPE